MAKRVFAIPGLVEEIYDFGDIGRDAHRQKMGRLRNEVRYWFYDAAKELEDSYYSTEYPSRNTDPFVMYLLDTYCIDDLVEYAKYFNRCRCCSRHSHYKSAAKPANPVPESNQTDRCYCKCRHYSRIFHARIL